MMQDDLLDIAETLAKLDPGRPRQASLRRAVSTAYYALFHALAALCADQLIGWKKPWEVFTPIYRSLDHSRAKDVFNRWGRRQGPELDLIGQISIKIQEERHRADYHPEPFHGRAETLDLIAQARTAISRLVALPSEDKLRLATQLITRKRN
jgi:hypothetical protein